MEQIKFKVNRACDCTTVCKYDNSRSVGSYACRGCRYNLGQWYRTENSGIVLCKKA